jgi:RNA polymerase sigma-70 factor (ECF subfamily)
MLDAGRGDLAAFEEIVRRHQGWAWSIAYRFLGQADDAEDAVQDAFLRLLDAAGRYRPSAAFKTYFHRIITRLCLDRARKRQPIYMEDVPDTADPGRSADDRIVQAEIVAAVRTALDALPPNQRMAVVLHYYEDLGYREIASAMETTPKAVERLLARGREGLRSILKSRKKL